MNEKINELETKLRDAEIRLNRFKREERRFRRRRRDMLAQLICAAVSILLFVLLNFLYESPIWLPLMILGGVSALYFVSSVVMLACGIRGRF